MQLFVLISCPFFFRAGEKKPLVMYFETCQCVIFNMHLCSCIEYYVCLQMLVHSEEEGLAWCHQGVSVLCGERSNWPLDLLEDQWPFTWWNCSLRSAFPRAVVLSGWMDIFQFRGLGCCLLPVAGALVCLVGLWARGHDGGVEQGGEHLHTDLFLSDTILKSSSEWTKDKEGWLF